MEWKVNSSALIESKTEAYHSLSLAWSIYEVSLLCRKMINLQWTSYSSSNFHFILFYFKWRRNRGRHELGAWLGKHPPSAGKDPGSPELDLRAAGVGKDKASRPWAWWLGGLRPKGKGDKHLGSVQTKSLSCPAWFLTGSRFYFWNSPAKC